MTSLAVLLLLAGSTVAVGLVVWQGVGAVAAVLGEAGWALVLLAPYNALPLVLAALSWRMLIAPAHVPPLSRVLLATWLGLGVNWLLPVAQIGGEVVKAHFLARRSTPGSEAAASVIIHKMLQAATQVVYPLAGLGLLVVLHEAREIGPAALAGAAVLGVALLVFYRLQRAGLFARLAHLTARLPRAERILTLADGARALDRAIGEGYRRGGRVAGAFLGHMAYRVAMAGEVWLALFLMGHPVGFAEAVILESLGQAVRAAAFAVPAGLGVQEGGFVVIGAALGLTPDVALALSLAKRARELLVGVPALVVLQHLEGRFLYRRGAGARR